MSAPGGQGQDEAALRAYYARRAGEYEAIYARPERQADLARLHADVAARFAGRRVIELACGTGWWTPHIASAAASVDAFDINEETLAIARTKPVDPARVRFAVGDAYAPLARGEPWTAAFAGFWGSHIPKRELPRFLDGLHRVLAPGARVVCIDNRYVEGSSTPLSRTDSEGNTYQSRPLADGTRHEVLKNFPEPAELESAVRDRADACEVRLYDYYWWLAWTVRAPRT